MRSMLRTMILAVALLSGTGILPAGSSSVQACPNCKAANETDPLRPKAYMYSILFMIAMPATIFTGFSLTFWRLSRQARTQQDAIEESDRHLLSDGDPSPDTHSG